MATGLILDVQRFSLHDGPGIRTTVFLKGCPLRCLWCHNPESQQRRVQYSFDYGKCTLCLQEGHECPNGVSLGPDGAVLHDRTAIDPSTFDRCPYPAGAVLGRERTAEDVLAEVMRDQAYYRRSGGGLTLSGGEPMAQFDFALALARAAKAEGLHVCLDTCGHAPWEQYAAIAPYVDLFLYDYKATDPALHRRLTGAGNEDILANLDALMQAGARVILRCPLVPGVNDDPAHLDGIAALARRYPGLAGVEIMAYHAMGHHKALRVGQRAPLAGLPTAAEAQKAAWLAALHSRGCTRARLG
ncbi:MAG: glycyl-radical enzyme activating protein [Symbiobacterium sp.]|uniref:glycyl-radical enzyme activating protein n=1 Tax=Symbiobacterium sp. TaxID=1971213 RepID=UPI003463ADE7